MQMEPDDTRMSVMEAVVTRRLARPLRWARVFATAACCAACSEPPVVPTQDPLQSTGASRIEGTVIATGTERGRAVVFLFDADRPPPPEGTGRPLSFALVGQEALYGASATDPTAGGPFTASFAFPLVEPGRYLLRGFLDTDGCVEDVSPCRQPDFNPFLDVTAGPNAGDVGGAAVDAVTLLPLELTIGEDLEPALEVPFSIQSSPSTVVPFDRPSFEVSGPTRWDPTTGPLQLTLTPRPIDGGVVHNGQPVFLARYTELNDNGELDPEERPSLWPRVVLRKVADADPTGLTDENDLDGDGVVDATGLDYPLAAGGEDGRPDAVVLAAAIDTTAFEPTLEALSGGPLPVGELSVVVHQAALDASGSAPVPLANLPPGRYAVTVLQLTGQTWRVPNELAPGLAEPLDLTPLPSQGYQLTVE